MELLILISQILIINLLPFFIFVTLLYVPFDHSVSASPVLEQYSI